MQKPSGIHTLPFNYSPFKTDYIAIAKEIVLKHIDASQYGIFVYGSRARGTNHRFSDLDIGILGLDHLPIMVLGNLEQELSESLVPFKVEAVDFTKVDERFKNEAMKNIIWWNKP